LLICPPDLTGTNQQINKSTNQQINKYASYDKALWSQKTSGFIEKFGL